MESLKYPTMVMSAVQAALEKAGTFISMISSASFMSSAAGSMSSESSSGNVKKKSRSEASRAAEAPSSSHDTARAVSRLLETLNKLQDLISEVVQHANECESNGHIEHTLRAGTGNKYSSSLVFSALHTLGDHFRHPSHLITHPKRTPLFQSYKN